MEREDPRATDADDVETVVHAYVVRDLLGQPALTLDPEAPLLGQFVDSLGLMRLLDFLEQRFGFTIADEDVVGVHFSTLAHIADFVRGKLGARPAQPAGDRAP